MSKQKDIDSAWWWQPNEEDRTENALGRAWELGRIHGKREEASRLAAISPTGRGDVCGHAYQERQTVAREIRQIARKLSRRLRGGR